MTDIFETGISRIEYVLTSDAIRVHEPHNGQAKWFKDELGQVWCKFITVTNGKTEQHVVLGSRIIEVVYAKT
jgi:hypothetical protein